MTQNRHIIKSIEPGSIAEEMELVPGDELLTVNGEKIEDVFDYHYQINDTYIELGIRRANGEEWVLEIDKEYDEDLGIVFENSLMDEYRSCRNNCVFCFIDQMPPGMRPTLYFKDDDSRLSFLQGNYVTLTNMSDRDIERIIRYRLEPINISFQTTNPELRCKMLHNRFAGDALNKVKRLFDAGIEMNGQIVLCKGLNDGKELERSISDLTAYLPHLKSVSVVPVGLSKYRDGLYPLEPFAKEDAREVLRVIRRWQEKLYKTWGLHFIHARRVVSAGGGADSGRRILRRLSAAGKRRGNAPASGGRGGAGAGRTFRRCQRDPYFSGNRKACRTHIGTADAEDPKKISKGSGKDLSDPQ